MPDAHHLAPVDLAAARRVWEAYRVRFAGEGQPTPGAVQAVLRAFTASFTAPTQPPSLVIDPPALLRWLIDDARGRATRYVVDRLGGLGTFLLALLKAGLLGVDPLADWRGSGWPAVARAIQSNDPERALAALRSAPQPTGPIGEHARGYLDLLRPLGYKCTGHRAALAEFDRFLSDAGIGTAAAVTRGMAERWISGLACGPYTRARKAQVARRFFDYLRSLCVVAENPVPPAVRVPNSDFRPFIFTREQIASLLAEAKQLRDGPLRRCRLAGTYFTMLALLCALGLRHGEALRLRLGDVDLERRALFIDRTKFHKSRYVSFGPKVGQILERYLDARRTILHPVGQQDPLFTTKWRKPMNPVTLMKVFRGLLLGLGIHGIEGQAGPRLHDLRHSFAVGRLLRWYQEGIDVQAKLPVLSTFLGHLGPKSTEVYLSITSELLQQASARFHREFGHAFDREPNP